MDFSSTYDTALLGTTQYGDLTMVDGDMVLTSDADARGTNPVLQAIIQRLRTFFAEYFLDNTLGLPWFQQMIGVNGATSTADGIIQNAILGTPGVQALTQYSSTYSGYTRLLTVRFTCNTVAGQVSYTGAVSPQLGGNQ